MGEGLAWLFKVGRKLRSRLGLGGDWLHVVGATAGSRQEVGLGEARQNLTQEALPSVCSQSTLSIPKGFLQLILCSLRAGPGSQRFQSSLYPVPDT